MVIHGVGKIHGVGDSAGTSLIAAGAAAGETPMRAGTTPAVAQQSCVNANGTWDAINNACQLPTYPTLPSYCSWVPFATTLLSECALPTTQDLTNMGAYTAYQSGMMQNDPSVTSSLMADNASSSQALENNTTCSYNAALNSPALSQIFGPDLTCALTDPTSPTFWLLYAVIGFAAYTLLKK